MLHIFLVILKIIGILLAAVLGIFLLVILSILFWPLRYHIVGRNKEGWNIKANVHFLGPLVWFSVLYEKEITYRLRILGIPILSSSKRKTKDSMNKKRKPKKKSTDHSILDEEEEWEKPVEHLHKQEDLLYIERMEEARNEYNKEQQELDSQEFSEEKTDSFWNKITTKIKLTYAKFQKIIQEVGTYYKKLKELYEDEGVRTGFTIGKAELLLLLKKIKPKKIRWYLKIGFEDPATTGQLLAGMAMVQGVWGTFIQIEPDFDHKIFETDFSIKGFIQGFRFLRLVLKCLFQKDIQYVWKKVKG